MPGAGSTVPHFWSWGQLSAHAHTGEQLPCRMPAARGKRSGEVFKCADIFGMKAPGSAGVTPAAVAPLRVQGEPPAPSAAAWQELSRKAIPWPQPTSEPKPCRKNICKSSAPAGAFVGERLAARPLQQPRLCQQHSTSPTSLPQGTPQLIHWLSCCAKESGPGIKIAKLIFGIISHS